MLLWLVASLALPVSGGPDTLEAVDVYGLRTVPEAAVRAAVGLSPGDPVPDSSEPIRSRLLQIAGIAEVDLSRVCCGESGGWLLYVGIRESGTPPLTFRSPPTGDERLPDEAIALGERFEAALIDAVRRGAADEDATHGYALSADSALRSIQEEFLEVARASFELLAVVVRNSSDASHRALAAQIIAYGRKKEAVVRELLEAIRDPAEEVRNDATRALALLAEWANQNPDAGLSIQGDVFVQFLNSLSWTDRNKAVFVLVALTAGRDPAQLAELRNRALPSLVEMARWSSAGHAMGSLILLARIAGVDDDEAFQAWQSGERETIIERAQTPRL